MNNISIKLAQNLLSVQELAGELRLLLNEAESAFDSEDRQFFLQKAVEALKSNIKETERITSSLPPSLAKDFYKLIDLIHQDRSSSRADDNHLIQDMDRVLVNIEKHFDLPRKKNFENEWRNRVQSRIRLLEIPVLTAIFISSFAYILYRQPFNYGNAPPSLEWLPLFLCLLIFFLVTLDAISAVRSARK